MLILTIIIRFLITFILSMAFGIERQRAHKPIGFATFTFVSIGSCGLAITAVSMSTDNPLPLLGAIVTGIGFLGAGALIKTTDKIFGFTSAASVWIFAIIGLVIGIGEYEIGIIIYISIWAVIIFDRLLEKKGIGSYQRKITIQAGKLVAERELKDVFLKCRIKKYKLIETHVDRKEGKLTKTYYIEGAKEDINKVPEELFDRPWFETCKIE